MSATSDGPIRYQVVYSEFVRNELKKLAARAKERGRDAQVLAALVKIDRLLHVFLQFGEPLSDLLLEEGQTRIVTVPPLVVRYALYQERRLVTVTIPVAPLSRSGI